MHKKLCKMIKVMLVGIVCGGGVLPLYADSTDNISMVTYFPVPYAAYNNIYTTEKFDVGTRNGSFTLNLGNSTDCLPGGESAVSLTADNVFLWHITNSSALFFDTDLYTPTAIFGNITSLEEGDLSFNTDLRVGQNFGVNTTPVDTVNAENVEVNNNVYLFSKAFSGNAALPRCDETVTWQQVTTDSGTHWYLVCGEPTAPPASCVWRRWADGDCKALPSYGEGIGNANWKSGDRWDFTCEGTIYQGVEAPPFTSSIDNSRHQGFFNSLSEGNTGAALCRHLPVDLQAEWDKVSATSPEGKPCVKDGLYGTVDALGGKYPYWQTDEAYMCKAYKCVCGEETVPTGGIASCSQRDIDECIHEHGRVDPNSPDCCDYGQRTNCYVAKTNEVYYTNAPQNNGVNTASQPWECNGSVPTTVLPSANPNGFLRNCVSGVGAWAVHSKKVEEGVYENLNPDCSWDPNLCRSTKYTWGCAQCMANVDRSECLLVLQQ